MHRHCTTKFLVLLGVLVYTFLAVGAVLEHCHTIDNVPGHEDHCQGCHFTHFTASPADKGQSLKADFVAVGEVLPLSPSFSFSTPDALLHNRAPPVGLSC